MFQETFNCQSFALPKNQHDCVVLSQGRISDSLIEETLLRARNSSRIYLYNKLSNSGYHIKDYSPTSVRALGMRIFKKSKKILDPTLNDRDFSKKRRITPDLCTRYVLYLMNCFTFMIRIENQLNLQQKIEKVQFGTNYHVLRKVSAELGLLRCTMPRYVKGLTTRSYLITLFTSENHLLHQKPKLFRFSNSLIDKHKDNNSEEYQRLRQIKEKQSQLIRKYDFFVTDTRRSKANDWTIRNSIKSRVDHLLGQEKSDAFVNIEMADLAYNKDVADPAYLGNRLSRLEGILFEERSWLTFEEGQLPPGDDTLFYRRLRIERLKHTVDNLRLLKKLGLEKAISKKQHSLALKRDVYQPGIKKHLDDLIRISTELVQLGFLTRWWGKDKRPAFNWKSSYKKPFYPKPPSFDPKNDSLYREIAAKEDWVEQRAVEVLLDPVSVVELPIITPVEPIKSTASTAYVDIQPGSEEDLDDEAMWGDPSVLAEIMSKNRSSEVKADPYMSLDEDDRGVVDQLVKMNDAQMATFTDIPQFIKDIAISMRDMRK